MRKAPIIFLVVISLLWHTFAMAHAGFAYQHGEGAAHVMLHLDKKPHHHHDDGSFHHDGSDESVKHVYSDACANPTAVVQTYTPSVSGDVATAAQFSSAPAAHDSPILEGPRRPPRLTA